MISQLAGNGRPFEFVFCSLLWCSHHIPNAVRVLSVQFSLLLRSLIGVLNFAATFLVLSSVSVAQAPTKYSVAQLKELSELPPSAQVTGAITKLYTVGIISPRAVVELDKQLMCEISFAPRLSSAKIRLEVNHNDLQVVEERFERASVGNCAPSTCPRSTSRPATITVVKTVKAVLKTLSVGQNITVSGIFVRKGNGIKLTGQLVAR
jgi:hypothetical protein